MGIRICPECGGKVSTTRNDCPHCGYDFVKTKTCPECEENIPIDEEECPVCGYRFNITNIDDNSQKNVDSTTISKEQKDVIIEDAPSATTEDVSFETEENNLETEIVVEEHNETSEVVKEDTIIDNDEVIASVDDTIATTVIEEIEEENTKSAVKCPYCGSKSLMPIGIEYYTCETCKGRFLNITGNGYVAHFVSVAKTSKSIETNSDVAEVSINESTTVELNNEFEVQSDENTNDNVDTVPALRKKIKENQEYCEKSEEKEQLHNCSDYNDLKRNIWIIATSIAMIMLVTFCSLTSYVFVPKSKYDKALALLDSNIDIDKAIRILDTCSWEDASNQACFAKARKAFNSKDFNYGIRYMHAGGGEVYVYYNTNGGMYVPEGIVISDGITASSAKTGYRFGGWELFDYNFSSNNYRVDLVLSAKWT